MRTSSINPRRKYRKTIDASNYLSTSNNNYMKSDLSIETINMPIHSNGSTRPGTRQDGRSRNNKSLKELMQDKSLMN